MRRIQGDKKSRLRRLCINFVVKIRPPDSQGHPYAVKILFARPYAVKIPFRIRPPDAQSCLSRQNSFSHTPARLTGRAYPVKIHYRIRPRQTHRSCLSRQNSFSHTVRPPDSQGRAYPVKIHFRAGGYERSIICLL